MVGTLVFDHLTPHSSLHAVQKLLQLSHHVTSYVDDEVLPFAQLLNT